MALELENKVKNANLQEIVLDVMKSKYGITFNDMVKKLLLEYKKNHKIR